MSRYVIPLASEITLETAGGKGTNLAELVRAGFPVPPGFIVTTEAYRHFIQANQLQARILALVPRDSLDRPDAFEKAAATIHDLFQGGTTPGDLGSEIASAYRNLSQPTMTAVSGVPVAVRSSATAEDLPGLAFAGLQDTYLNILGEEAVLDAVKKCWGSLWTARALAYRARNHISPEQVALAVVVQKLIVGEASGILFTANPLTGHRQQMVIDASNGLGEAIVSGQVEPDHFVIDSQTWQIVERRIGSKARITLPRADGGIEQVERSPSQAQALPDTQVIDLAQLGRRVAEHFGSPQDIEWVWAHQQFHLVQSRPITSLYPLPENNPNADGLRVYVNFNSIQGVTDPLTPLGIDALRLLFGGVRQLLHLHSSMRDLLPDAGGRLFMDMTGAVRDPRLRNAVLSFLAQSDPGARQALRRLLDQGRIPPQHTLTPGRALALISSIVPILGRVLHAWLAPEQVQPRVLAAADRFIADVQAHVQAAPDLGARLRAMRADLSHADDISLTVMPTALPVFATLPLLNRWLTEWLGEKPGAALSLMRGLNNVTTEMNLALWQVAQVIRSDPQGLSSMRSQSVESLVTGYLKGQWTPVAQGALAKFLNSYGMRAVGEIDMGRPRWSEDPTPIVQTLLAYLQLDDPKLAPDVLYLQNRREAEQLAAEYITRARKMRLGWLRAGLIKALVRRMRALSGLREIPLFYMVKTLAIYRTALLESGRELVAEGMLDCPEDLFFLPLDTVEQVAGSARSGGQWNLKELVTQNRSAYERECARKQMPRILLSTGESLYQGASDAMESETDLVGEAVSPGIAEGTVRVILDPRGAHLEPGEILVCPSTDPGWTPLFLTASGLVMEIGGMITHGSVVAREYGLPAVVGVQDATRRLATGQRVRVDGNRGSVTVLSPNISAEQS